MRGTWHGKSVLITGVRGTAGRELPRQTAAFPPSGIIGMHDPAPAGGLCLLEQGAEPASVAPELVKRHGNRIDARKIVPRLARSAA